MKKPEPTLTPREIFNALDWRDSELAVIPFQSEGTLLGKPILIWDQTVTTFEWRQFSKLINGKQVITLQNSRIIKGRMNSRSRQIQEHLDSGGMLVIFPASKVMLQDELGRADVFDPNNLLPENFRIIAEPNEGNGGHFIASEPFAQLGRLLSSSYHQVTFQITENFKKLGNINGHPARVLSAISTAQIGTVLYIPSIIAKSRFQLFHILYDIYNALNKKVDVAQEPLPEYAMAITFSDEYLEKEEIRKLSSEISRIGEELSAKQNHLKRFERLKVLIAGKHSLLQSAVSELFKELDFKVEDTDTRQEDLVIERGDFLAAIEIKGKKGTSGTGDRRQLQDWVGNVSKNRGIDPKGILIVNGYNEKHPSERTEPVFPDEMLEKSIQFEYCLMTTIQLLSEFLAIKAGKTSTEEFVKRISSTKGIYASPFKLTDWLKENHPPN